MRPCEAYAFSSVSWGIAKMTETLSTPHYTPLCCSQLMCYHAPRSQYHVAKGERNSLMSSGTEGSVQAHLLPQNFSHLLSTPLHWTQSKLHWSLSPSCPDYLSFFPKSMMIITALVMYQFSTLYLKCQPRGPCLILLILQTLRVLFSVSVAVLSVEDTTVTQSPCPLTTQAWMSPAPCPVESAIQSGLSRKCLLNGTVLLIHGHFSGVSVFSQSTRNQPVL